jgi:hypothetical protein
MPYFSRISKATLIASSALLFIACGGGGNLETDVSTRTPSAAIPEKVALGSVGTCSPTLTQFKSITYPMLNPAQVSKELGCEGQLVEFLQTVFTRRFGSSGFETLVAYKYEWRNNTGGPSLVLYVSKETAVSPTEYNFIPSYLSFETKQNVLGKRA